MEIVESREAGFLVLGPVGRLDAKESRELETKLAGFLDAGERRLVVDMTRTEHISSTGIRVLIAVAKKLRSSNGYLALCSVRASVAEVLEVAKLTSSFVIATTRQEAFLGAPEPPRPASLEELAIRLLGGTPGRASQRPAPGADVQAHARRAAAVLGAVATETEPAPAPAQADSTGSRRPFRKSRS
ncbi:MAG TPA: STAS domain-containing protein [Thermoanaerobaculia bacterium]|nr:STAS domain-containing protein [Thermoanaerobaculia bacterium]